MLFGNKKQKPSSSGVSTKATQSFLKVSEIRNDTLILNDGTLRAVLAVASTNFDLKSQEEQDALIYNYQRFLNSLDFHVQILVQSRRMNISDYIQTLKGYLERQTNELLRVQTAEYIDFVQRLVESANVMNKEFYCIIPYSYAAAKKSSGILSFFKKSDSSATQAVASFEKNRQILDERVVGIMNSLGSMGLRVVRLTTEQLVELMYNSYNFDSGPEIDASQLENVTLEAQKE